MTTQVIIPSVPTPSSHLHLEQRLKWPRLGWRPHQICSGPSVLGLRAGVCSDDKDKNYYRATQRTIQSVNTSQTPSVGIYNQRPHLYLPPPPRPQHCGIPAQPAPPWLGSSASGRDNGSSRSELPQAGRHPSVKVNLQGTSCRGDSATSGPLVQETESRSSRISRWQKKREKVRLDTGEQGAVKGRACRKEGPVALPPHQPLCPALSWMPGSRCPTA